MTELRKRTQEMYRRAVRQLAEHYRKSRDPFSARENGRLCPKLEKPPIRAKLADTGCERKK